MDTGAGGVSVLAGGRVVSAAGGTSGRGVEVEVADRYQSLDRTISWDAIADVVPSRFEATEGVYVGLQSLSLTDMVLRSCGWYSTPPRLPFSTLSVPAQGTMWPEAGTINTSMGTGGGYPGWQNTPWGIGVSNVTSTYALAGAGYSIKDRNTAEFTAMTHTTEDACRLDLVMSGTTLARMSWSDSTAYLWVRNSAGSLAVGAQITRGAGFLYGTVEYVSDTSVRCTIRSGGSSATAVVACDAQVTTGKADTAIIRAGQRAGGFQIAYPTTAGSLANWTPNAVLYPRTSNRNSLFVRKPVLAINCADFLRDQCEAEAATYWIDETGVLRWWDLARLEANANVATLNSDDDISDAGFSWEHSLSAVKSRVVVNWDQPLRTMSWRTTVDLWQGGGSTIQSGEGVSEEWINVPNDEVWLRPDLTLDRVGDAYGNYNLGIGSWYGGITDAGNNSDHWAQLDGSLSVTIERVTDESFKLSTSWGGNVPMTQRTLSAEDSSGTGLWRRRTDSNLPILRGKAKYVFAEQTTTSAQSGPQSAPELTIDAGWLIQRPEQAQYTADYAGQRLTVPQPVLSSVALIPIPGLQLGDVVEVRDDHVTRLTIRGIVVEDSRSINADMDMSHAVSIRPTYVTRNGVTWEEWGQAASVTGAGTYQSWGSRQSGNTYQQWGANPLLGEAVL